jgi:hypothetical protein
MRIKVISALLLFIFTSPLYSQSWYTQDVDKMASIDFPSQPVFKDTLSQKIFRYETDSVYYILVVQDASDISKFKIKEADLDEFYRGYIEVAIEDPKKEIISRKNFTCGKIKGIEVEYASGESLSPNIFYKRVLFFNKKIYQYNVLTWNEYKKSNEQNRIKFFSSFRIKANNNDLYGGNISSLDSAYEAGAIAGRWTARIIMMLVPLGIMLLIVYLARRAKNNRAGQ